MTGKDKTFEAQILHYRTINYVLLSGKNNAAFDSVSIS